MWKSDNYFRIDQDVKSFETIQLHVTATVVKYNGQTACSILTPIFLKETNSWISTCNTVLRSS